MTDTIALRGGPMHGKTVNVDPKDKSICFPTHVPGHGYTGHLYALERVRGKVLYGIYVGQESIERA